MNIKRSVELVGQKFVSILALINALRLCYALVRTLLKMDYVLNTCCEHVQVLSSKPMKTMLRLLRPQLTHNFCWYFQYVKFWFVLFLIFIIMNKPFHDFMNAIHIYRIWANNWPSKKSVCAILYFCFPLKLTTLSIFCKVICACKSIYVVFCRRRCIG